MTISMEEILKKARISWVISVDDDHGIISTEQIIEILRHIMGNPQRYGHLFEKIGVQDDFEEDDDDSEIDYAFLAENVDIESLKPDISEIIPSNALKDIIEGWKDNKTIKDYLCLSSVKEAKQVLIESTPDWKIDNDNRILWLIDRDFSNSGENTNAGLELIKLLSTKGNNNICLLLTEKTSDLENIKTKQEFLSKQDLAKYVNLIMVIPKENFYTKLDDKETIINILKGFWSNYNYLLINQLTDYLEKGMKNAKENSLKFPASIIRHILINSHETEGVSLPESLSKMILTLAYVDFGKMYSRDKQSITKLLSDYKQINGEEDINSEEDIQIINNLNHIERYDDQVNILRQPIGFGDIFEIGEDFFILLSQPCDVTYRFNDGRNIQKALLGKLEPFSKKQKGNHFSELLKYSNLDKNKIYRLDFRNFILMNFEVLDLCTFNDSGKAEIKKDIIEEGNEVQYIDLLPYPEKRIADIILYIKDTYFSYCELKTSVDQLNGLCKEHEEARKAKTLFKRKLDEFRNMPDFPIENNGMIAFKVKRITKLKEPFSIKLYSEYTNYHARIGTPGDLGRGFLSEEAPNPAEAILKADVV